MTGPDLRPDPEFAGELRTWFVHRLSAGPPVPSPGPSRRPEEPVEVIALDPPAGARRRRLLAVAVAAAFVAAVALLATIARPDARPTTTQPAAADRLTAICRELDIGYPTLSLTPSAADVTEVAHSLDRRLAAVRAELSALDTGGIVDAGPTLALVSQLEAFVDALGVAATTDDPARLDGLAGNIDVLVEALSARLEDLGGQGCRPAPAIRGL